MWGFSIFLTLLGLLPFSPIAMIVSGIILVVTSYLSNVLFAWLFGVRPHSESSYISALILFFLFSPSLGMADMTALALAAALASGSKYLLAVRGRHIFNPAALATVIISVTGLAYATWWIATPILLPITAVFAFLILYKTRRLLLGAVFLALAIPLILANYLLNEQSLIEAVLALPSWPLLFLVGFMLSEPLTLPPRRWQQLTVGIIVAILFAVPFHIVGVSGSPALALVAGNVVAFLLARRQKLQLTFKRVAQLTPTISEYSFSSDTQIHFTAGQYMEITVPHPHKDGRGIRRVFSIVSAPGDSVIRFGIKMYERPSSFKRTLTALQDGDIIDATSVAGDFVLPKDAGIPLLFIAGGIGITPFISHLLALEQQKQHRDITLIYMVSDIDDMAYVSIIKGAGVRVIIVTKTNKAMPVASWIHHNGQRLTNDDVIRYIPDAPNRHAYISGPPAMVDSMKHAVRQTGVKHVKSDYFTGY
jgi:ferredoxin-NADP reductase